MSGTALLIARSGGEAPLYPAALDPTRPFEDLMDFTRRVDERFGGPRRFNNYIYPPAPAVWLSFLVHGPPEMFLRLWMSFLRLLVALFPLFLFALAPREWRGGEREDAGAAGERGIAAGEEARRSVAGKEGAPAGEGGCAAGEGGGGRPRRDLPDLVVMAAMAFLYFPLLVVNYLGNASVVVGALLAGFFAALRGGGRGASLLACTLGLAAALWFLGPLRPAASYVQMGTLWFAAGLLGWAAAREKAGAMAIAAGIVATARFPFLALVPFVGLAIVRLPRRRWESPPLRRLHSTMCIFQV